MIRVRGTLGGTASRRQVAGALRERVTDLKRTLTHDASGPTA